MKEITAHGRNDYFTFKPSAVLGLTRRSVNRKLPHGQKGKRRKGNEGRKEKNWDIGNGKKMPKRKGWGKGKGSVGVK